MRNQKKPVWIIKPLQRPPQRPTWTQYNLMDPHQSCNKVCLTKGDTGQIQHSTEWRSLLIKFVHANMNLRLYHLSYTLFTYNLSNRQRMKYFTKKALKNGCLHDVSQVFSCFTVLIWMLIQSPPQNNNAMCAQQITTMWDGSYRTRATTAAMCC